MITIKARLNVSANGGAINSLSSNVSGNNVSADINDIIGKRSVKFGNPFILGESVLDSGATYTDTLPYFLGSQLSDSNGNFAQTYTITINGVGLSSAIIVFDKENNAHPNTITVDGVTVYDDDAQFELVFASASTHRIEISNWNKPYSPLIITAIYADINIEIGKNNLLSFNSDIYDRTNVQQPSYGIVSNSANLSFSDLDEQTLDLINQRILHSGIQADVWLDNSDSNTQEQVCSMAIKELSYDNDNRQVQVSLRDSLEEWQYIPIEPIYYNPLLGEEKTAKWVYQYLYNKTPKKYGMQSFEELDTHTQEILENTTIKYPVLKADNLWNNWNKLCDLCLLHIYIDNNGKTICRSDS